MRKLLPALVISAALSLPAHALTPFPRPVNADGIPNGVSEPFAGQWSVTLPTMEVTEGDTVLASCDRPVTIEAADERHIFYIAPRQEAREPAMELIDRNGGTVWEPIAGGPRFFAYWRSADNFYLYDEEPLPDADWVMPYVYVRC